MEAGTEPMNIFVRDFTRLSLSRGYCQSRDVCCTVLSFGRFFAPNIEHEKKAAFEFAIVCYRIKKQMLGGGGLDASNTR